MFWIYELNLALPLEAPRRGATFFWRFAHIVTPPLPPTIIAEYALVRN